VTWHNRFKLLLGLLVVAAVAGAAVVRMDASRAWATSRTAEIDAETYTVGTPYGGTVVDPPVEVGADVAAGDPLFVIASPDLDRALAEGLVDGEVGQGDIDAAGHFVVRAAKDGVVVASDVTQGSFVQAYAEIATVETAGTAFVAAQLDMTTSEYGRLEDGADVEVVLPDGRTVDGAVRDVSVTTADSGVSRVLLEVASDGLVALAAQDRLVTTGTPVTARVALRNDGLVHDMSQVVRAAVERSQAAVTSVVASATTGAG
jgi:multidrug resistance efflux pump